MDMSVRSKVDEINLRPYEYLLPVFEVIVNAIISVNTKHQKNGGLIFIEVERSKSIDSNKSVGLFAPSEFQNNDGKAIPGPISSITVKDNGIGFDEKNFASFNKAYSDTYKLQGCKGVGRFTVLACFEKMEVDSIFKTNGKQFRREFSFDVEREVNEKNGSPFILVTPEKQETIVKITSYKQPFKARSAINSAGIAEAIIEHCLPYFIDDTIPTIVLKDDFESTTIILNDIFREVVHLDGPKRDFKLLDSEPAFKMIIVKRFDQRNRIHRLKLCANSRVVGRPINIASLIDGFESPLPDAESEPFFIDVYVTSDFLDRKVNTVRNNFHIPDSLDEDELHDEITIKSIKDGVAKILLDKYEKHIEHIHEQNFEKIKRYILNPSKMRFTYRSLLSRPDLLRSIPTNASNDAIEEHLHRIKFQLEKDVTKNIKKALRKASPENYDEYSQTLKGLIDQEAKLSKDKLADLLIRRKSIIALFKKLYRFTKDDKYHYEEDLHNIIFPMGETTDSIPYEYHNLWLLDERLAFHSYIASDKKLRTNPILDSKSPKEPDLLIFDIPWAFSEKENQISSMVIFEFKRPGRDMNTTNDKNLDTQVMEYFQTLMESKSKDYNGEYINMEQTTPKFGYVICDLHKDLVTHNTHFNGFRATPHKTLYKLNDVINLHVEAMSYQQLIEMCEKRHSAFFKELGLDAV